jgi:hypothetical protein
MKLLVITTRLFGAAGSGGEVCTARLLTGLREGGHRVVLAGRGDAASAARWCDEAVSLGPLEPPFDEQPLAQRLRAVTWALAAGEAITVQRLRPVAARAALRPLWAHGFDACIVDHLQAWPWLGAAPSLPTMLVQHNVESDNYRRQARAANRGCQGNPTTRHLERALMRREAERLRHLEHQALRQAAVVACLSEADAQRMADLAAAAHVGPCAPLRVLPGYPMHRVMDPPAPAADGQRRIGLIGTWTWAPNRAGLRWLLQAVWPRLQGRCRLVLAGTGLDGLVLPPGTQRLGRVADVREFYAAVDAVAVPSLQGSGVQEKAIEAIGSGRAVVATAHALRGLGPRLPAGVHVADNAERFAHLCLHAPLQPSAAEAAAWQQERRLGYRQALHDAVQALAAAAVVSSAAAPAAAAAAARG